MGRVDVETPESVRFTLELADIGSRGLAFAVDTLIRFVAVSAGLLVLNGLRVDLTEAWAAFGIALFLLNWFYFVAFELLWNGQTPGKRLVGLRTVAAGGFPVGALSSVIRNLLRVVDGLPLGYGVAMVSAFADPQHRRLGDLVAGTYVIRDRPPPRAERPIHPRPAPPEAAWAFGLSAIELDATTRELVHGYLERRPDLAPDAVPRVRARVVEGVLARLGDRAERDRLIEDLPAGDAQDRFLEALLERELRAGEGEPWTR